MKTCVIISTVRASQAFEKYAENFATYNHDADILIIDEQGNNRKQIAEQLQNFNVEFYGVKERRIWFNEQGLGNVDDVIPKRAHNENSFGLLVAYTRNYDMIVFIDDDTYPASEKDFLGEHWKNLNAILPIKKSLNSSWVSTHPKYYPRGFPYNQRVQPQQYIEQATEDDPVLNMGLWSGIPDLNAVDCLALNPPSEDISTQSFIVAHEQFVPICSMNLAFKPEIIPAYYQLWHTDRYDDIFSGLFLKKIADYLGENISIGTPIVQHDKAPRNIFADIQKELLPMQINEWLWQVLLKISLTERTWLECYKELAFNLVENSTDSYIKVMAKKMVKWTETVEALT